MLDLTKVEPQVDRMAKYLAENVSFAQALLRSGQGRQTLVNLAPLPLPAGVLEDLEKALGHSVVEIRFPAQFELDRPLRPQVAALLHKVEARLRILNVTSLDYLVLPELPAAAYLVAEAFTRADAQAGPGVVWIKRAGDTMVLGGVE